MHYASRLTGWNAIKSRAEQLNIDMSDAQVKQCTAKIKALADVRSLAVNDVDDIIRDFHRNLKLGGDGALQSPPLAGLTEAEQRKVAEKEKRVLEDGALDQEMAEADRDMKRVRQEGMVA